MHYAPQHDWSYYESQVRASDRDLARGLTTSERFAVYASFFDAIWTSRQQLPLDWEQLEGRRWQRKAALRRQMVEAFRKLDELRRERSSAKDSR
jgi:hypothetical protein